MFACRQRMTSPLYHPSKVQEKPNTRTRHTNCHGHGTRTSEFVVDCSRQLAATEKRMVGTIEDNEMKLVTRRTHTTNAILFTGEESPLTNKFAPQDLEKNVSQCCEKSSSSTCRTTMNLRLCG